MIKIENSDLFKCAAKVARAIETLKTSHEVARDSDASPETVEGWRKEAEKRLRKVESMVNYWVAFATEEVPELGDDVDGAVYYDHRN